MPLFLGDKKWKVSRLDVAPAISINRGACDVGRSGTDEEQ